MFLVLLEYKQNDDKSRKYIRKMNEKTNYTAVKKKVWFYDLHL